jgi:preprotein translocase subunit YajC
MLSLFLTEGTSSSSGSTTSYVTYILLAVVIVAMVAMWVISSKRNKKRQKEAEDLINAVKPGNKVKTIGGICGIVVEVNEEENTFVLETGSEASGKCYLKFDKQAIYQTDAVAPKADEKKADKDEKEEEKTEEVFDDATLSEKKEEAPATEDKTDDGENK